MIRISFGGIVSFIVFLFIFIGSENDFSLLRHIYTYTYFF